jgi:hypothetical protein
MAGFNDYPASRDGELDRVSGRSVQLLQHAPFLRRAVCRVVQGAHKVQGQAFGLAGPVPTLARVQPMTPLRVTLTA